MRKIIAAICMIAIIFTVIAPISLTEVFAEVTSEGWSDWTLSGDAKISGGILTMKSGTTDVTYKKTMPDKFILNFSMKVNSASSSMGIQGGNGASRGGFYFTSSGIRAMDDAETPNVWPSYSVPDITAWHDYVLEVDHLNKVEKVYVDEELIATIPLKANTSKTYRFWCYGSGGSVEIADISIGTEAPKNPEMELTMDYTEPFFHDFNEVGGWRVEPEPYCTLDEENGIMRLRVIGDMSYRSFERPLNPPANYDMEFRLRFPQLPQDGSVSVGTIWISLSDKEASNWICIDRDRIAFWEKSMETNHGDPLNENPKGSILHNLQYDTWQTWKASVREGNITWFLDDKKLFDVPMVTEGSWGWNAVAVWVTNHAATQLSDVECDWIKYEPYFEDELSLDFPYNNSRFAEGGDILLKASTPSGAEKIDYYVNDVLVGSGYKKNGYSYTLKNARVGKYRVKARLANIETPEAEITVKNLVKADILLSKKEVNIGEKVTATVNAEALSPISKVEFYVNGDLHSTDKTAPYTTELSSDNIGTVAVRAKVFTEKEAYAETKDANLVCRYVEGKPFKITGEYEVSYEYDGKSGSVEVKDGYFTLNLAHKGDTVTYKTTEGEESYKGLKAGKYKMIVSAGYGEFYWNDQFVFSCRLPYTPGAGNSKKVVSLKNVKFKGTGVKTTYSNVKTAGKTIVTDETWNNQYYSFEFDKKDSSPEIITYNDGIFRNTLYFREDGLYAKRLLSTASKEPDEIKICDKVMPGYYRVTVAYGIAIVNLDNKPIGEYRCVQATGIPMVKRESINPDGSTFIAVKNSDEKFYHTDTFEDITEFPSGEYWIVNNITYKTAKTDVLTAVRKEINGNHYMNIEGSGTYVLNAIDLNPTFKWRGMVNSKSGDIFILIRRSYDDAHTKLGYNFEKQEWYLETTETTEEKHLVKTQYDPKAFETGKWYNFELISDDHNFKLLRDGKAVFEAKLPNYERILMYGRFGFGAVEGSYNFDDVVFESKDRAIPGFSFTTGNSFGRSETNTAASFYKDTEGNVVATGGTNSLITYDKGKTWGELVLPTDSNTKGRIFSEQDVMLPDGRWVKVNPSYGGGAHTSQVSTDGGKTWTEASLITDSHGHIGAVSRFNGTQDGRVFYCTTRGSEYFGLQYVFYSDDGINWTKSETDLTTINTGVVINEAMVVDTPREDEVWFYARTDTGFIMYWISYDNGKTFDTTPHYSGLPQAACCFRIERDRENPDTYYAIFAYDATDTVVRNLNYPRTRTALAVSYDGMETWEYAADIFEGSVWGYGLNTSDGIIKVIDDTIYWRTLNRGGSNAATNFGSLDKTKIKPLKRFPQIHQRILQGFEFGQHGAVDGCAIPKKDGRMWAYDGYYPAKVSDGRVDAKTAEYIFGATTKNQGSDIVMMLGDAKLVLSDGSSSCEVNGETRNFDRAVNKGGYLDIKSLCEIFGKEFTETDKVYTVMECNYIDKYQSMLDEMAF